MSSNKQFDAVLAPAIEVLTDAEGRLRAVAAKAASSGEYDALAVITHWAKTLQSLASEVNGTADTARPPVVSGTKTAVSSTRPKGKLQARTPVYSRDADMLVKTAKSRKSKVQYQHRAPADVVETVSECLADWRPSKKLLTGEQLLGQYEKKKGTVVSYQVYVALGWLTQIGLLRRHGRSGYSVPQPSTIVGDMQRAWSALKNGENQ